jgi:ABC-type uncharacterized transport system substrate-binding protein
MSLDSVARIFIERQGLFRLTPQQLHDRRNTLPLDHSMLTSIILDRGGKRPLEQRIASLSWTKGRFAKMHYFSLMRGAGQHVIISFCY